MRQLFSHYDNISIKYKNQILKYETDILKYENMQSRNQLIIRHLNKFAYIILLGIISHKH